MFLLYFLVKKLNILNIVLLFLAIILGILLFADNPSLYSYGEETHNVVVPSLSPSPTFTPSPTPTPFPVLRPTKLIIPKLKVESPIDYVSVDAEGKMDVPSDPSHVAWFSEGFKPGEKGSAVMAGHYDNADGSPAVFYNLESLVEGDEIYVLDEAGNELQYRVKGTVEYDMDTAPLEYIFGEADASRLNLITCSGIFNNSIQSYSHRTVVFTELVE